MKARELQIGDKLQIDGEPHFNVVQRIREKPCGCCLGITYESSSEEFDVADDALVLSTCTVIRDGVQIYPSKVVTE